MALGVATLIIVLSVMGGFRQQLLGRIIGMNGHIVITARDGGMLQATPELLAKLQAFARRAGGPPDAGATGAGRPPAARRAARCCAACGRRTCCRATS